MRPFGFTRHWRSGVRPSKSQHCPRSAGRSAAAVGWLLAATLAGDQLLPITVAIKAIPITGQRPTPVALAKRRWHAAAERRWRPGVGRRSGMGETRGRFEAGRYRWDRHAARADTTMVLDHDQNRQPIDLRANRQITYRFRRAAVSAGGVRLHRRIGNMPASPSLPALSSPGPNRQVIYRSPLTPATPPDSRGLLAPSYGVLWATAPSSASSRLTIAAVCVANTATRNVPRSPIPA